jgi:hypothetical protein
MNTSWNLKCGEESSLDSAGEAGNLLRKIVSESVKASGSTGVLFGVVDSENPLIIKVGDKLTLKERHLQLTNAVRDHYVFLEAYDNSDAFIGNFSASGGASGGQSDPYHVTENNTQDMVHTHGYSDNIEGVPTSSTTAEQTTTNTDHDHHYKGGVFKVKLGLKKGENVILIRIQGGQKFLVLDRMNPPTGQEGKK